MSRAPSGATSLRTTSCQQRWRLPEKCTRQLFILKNLTRSYIKRCATHILQLSTDIKNTQHYISIEGFENRAVGSGNIWVFNNLGDFCVRPFHFTVVKIFIFYCFVIFSKFLDEIEDNAPEHHTK